MSIHEIRGNLIGLAETGVLDGIAHGCNCLHAMGSGVAGQLARRYPDVPAVDIEETVCGDRLKLGTYTSALVDSVLDSDISFEVINLYTQYAPSYDGSDVFEYEKFRMALQLLSQEISSNETICKAAPYRLGFPKIGAGLAGGDWERIKSSIIATFGEDQSVEVYLVEWDGSDLPQVVENHSQVHF